MKFVFLKGGLGNQIFQYLVFKRLQREGGKVFLMNDYLLRDGKRNYELNFLFNNVKSLGILFPLYYATMLLCKKLRVGEKLFYSDSNCNDMLDSMFYDGYWQDRKWHEEYLYVSKDINFESVELSKGSLETLREIKKSESPIIALHVRRGDYVTEKVASNYHGTLSKRYYINAVRVVEESIKERCKLFVFSDDIEWCRQNFHDLNGVTYISGEGKSSVEDMYLMSLCDHHVISNSTYSFWAAILNENARKVVVRPRIWFNKGEDEADHITPKDWIKL